MNPLAKVCFALAGGSTQKVHKLSRVFVKLAKWGTYNCTSAEVVEELFKVD